MTSVPSSVNQPLSTGTHVQSTPLAEANTTQARQRTAIYKLTVGLNDTYNRIYDNYYDKRELRRETNLTNSRKPAPRACACDAVANAAAHQAFKEHWRLTSENIPLWEVLGEGGFGKVYASPFPNGNEIAIKIIEPKEVPDSNNDSDDTNPLYDYGKYTSIAQREIDYLKAASSSPFIVQYIGHTERPPCERSRISYEIIVLMERVKGRDLGTFLDDEGPLSSYKKVQLLAFQILSAETHLNSLGLTCSDLKPQNIMWNDQANRAVLIDGGSFIRADRPYTDMKNFCTSGYLPWEAYCTPNSTIEGSMTKATLFSYGAVIYEATTAEMLLNRAILNQANLCSTYFNERITYFRLSNVFSHWTVHLSNTKNRWQIGTKQMDEYACFVHKLIAVTPNQRLSSAREALTDCYFASMREYAAESFCVEESKEGSA